MLVISIEIGSLSFKSDLISLLLIYYIGACANIKTSSERHTWKGREYFTVSLICSKDGMSFEGEMVFFVDEMLFNW